VLRVKQNVKLKIEEVVVDNVAVVAGQRMRVRVESRLAMKVVPIMGRPRGPGGRLRGDAEAVADMSRQLLGDEIALMIRQTRGVDFVSGGIGNRRRVTCNLKA